MLNRIRHTVRTLQRSAPYITPLRAANLVLNQVEARAGRTRLLSHPHVLYVEPSAVCNSDCQLCPVGLKYHRRAREGQQRYMTLEDFRTIIDKYRRYGLAVRFGLWGEPTMNRDLAAMVAHTHAERLHTAVVTNGAFSRSRLARFKDLFAAGLDHAVVSCHGVSRESYSTYQPSKELGDNWRVIEELSDHARALGLNNALSLVFAVTSRNEHELDLFRTHCKRLGAEPVILSASLNVGSMATADQRRRRIRAWSPSRPGDDPRYPYYDGLAAGTGQGAEGHPPCCGHLTCVMSVQVNGDVVICGDAFPPHGETFRSAGLVLGNLLEPGVSLGALWNSPAFRAGRELVLRKDRGTGGGAPCHHCMSYIA